MPRCSHPLSSSRGGQVHCVKIELDGYKRLSSTSCNTDTRLLAFVGPNEAGKSSLLQALRWLSDPAESPLNPKNHTRGRELDDDHAAVRMIFELGPDDLTALSDLAVAEPITGYRVSRRVNGVRGSDASPFPERDPAPFVDLETRINRGRRNLAAQIAAASKALREEELDDNETSHLPDPDVWFNELIEGIADREATGWPNELSKSTDAVVEWLESVAPTSRSGKPRDVELAGAIRTVVSIIDGEHPASIARRRLMARMPRVIEFTEEQRELQRVHVISDEDARNDLAPAMKNLLQIAELDVDKLWSFIERDMGSAVESTIAEANVRLSEFFGQAWNQSKVTVHLKVDSQRLELWLAELDNKAHITDIEERSDGLLMFVALAAFVASQRLNIPPILLIDEAETHLHFDAQADLVGVLLKQVKATQVFYTTHSPGCLPADLGTGIRLVQRSKSNTGISKIHNDFWTNEEPGFAPLLYAMGATAAAFSRCRLAVLAEGAADMVLLPTLLRKAAGIDDLEYQVAPGLANAHAYGMDVEDIAAKVVYLTDGDTQGATYRKQLKDAEVADVRVFQLPDKTTSEDLLDRDYFIRVANDLLPDGAAVASKDLPASTPIAKAFELWAKKNGYSVGHVALAYGLIAKPKKIVFAPGAVEALRRLHDNFMSAFNAPN